MIDKIKELIEEAEAFTAQSKEEIETFRIKYLGKKGLLNDFFAEFKNVANDQKKEFGQTINKLKTTAQEKVNSLNAALEGNDEVTGIYGDLSRPGDPIEIGSRHPISLVKNQIIDIFSRIGFNVSEGPEIEDDWHNFTALNLPEYHPARDMQDTFFIQTDPDILLRTHTSSVQVRYMENNKPPIRTISPGRVYRNEAISARSHCFFHQVEGLYIDKNVSFADLKQTLQYFTTEMFGKSKIRLRPSYFPFTEPSAEVDVYWGLETETDHKMTKGTGWLEIMGCGMVDPNVLDNCGIDSKEYSGFAFGMGIDRIALLLHQISDIRLLSENDIRFFKAIQVGLLILKKDISIPNVEDIYIAVVQEYNEIYKTKDWSAYIINDKEVALEMILIVSEGYLEDTITSTMRHKLEVLPPKSYAKIELMQEDVLQLNNTFKITFFENSQMFEKTYLFRKNTINEKALRPVPLMSSMGVLVK